MVLRALLTLIMALIEASRELPHVMSVSPHVMSVSGHAELCLHRDRRFHLRVLRCHLRGEEGTRACVSNGPAAAAGGSSVAVSPAAAAATTCSSLVLLRAAAVTLPLLLPQLSLPPSRVSSLRFFVHVPRNSKSGHQLIQNN